MIVNIIIGVACLFVGWNTPQPMFAQKLENKIRVKLGKAPKTLREPEKSGKLPG